MKKQFLILAPCLLLLVSCMGQPLNKKKNFTKQDTLRGSIGPERAWWDVLHYSIVVTPDYDTKTIVGKTRIVYKVLPNQTIDYMQIDLQKPLVIDTIFYDDPTAGLDPITSKKIVELIKNLNKSKGTTTVAITNDMNRAFQMADTLNRRLPLTAIVPEIVTTKCLRKF